MNFLPLSNLMIGLPEAQRSPMARSLLYLRSDSLKERRSKHFVRCARCRGDATEWYANDLSSWPFGVRVMDTQVARESSEMYTKESTTAMAPLGQGDFHLALLCPGCFARLLSELAPRE